MTKKELLNLLQDIPDETEIFINGYEGGYDRLENIHSKSLYYSPSSYCGDYNEWFEDDAKEYNGIPKNPDIINAIVLNRNDE